ncbi:hypothetical protein GEMRC1_012062 [Eukaryota sp. GEM-RC1]
MLDSYDNYWNDAELLVKTCAPIITLLRIADQSSAGFVSFAHFGLGVVRNSIRTALMQTGKSLSYSIDELKTRSEQLDSQFQSRLNYVTNRSLIAARLLNPALREENCEKDYSTTPTSLVV